jgi:hypothetical protein
MRGGALARGVTAVFVLAPVLLGGGPAPGLAATIYRCGADGRTFSQTPCPASAAGALEVSDARDADQRAEAQDAARRTAAAADGMAAARERLEAQRVRAPGIIPVTRTVDGDLRSSGRKTPRKKKRDGEDGLTAPFKGVPTDEGNGKKKAR